MNRHHSVHIVWCIGLQRPRGTPWRARGGQGSTEVGEDEVQLGLLLAEQLRGLFREKMVGYAMEAKLADTLLLAEIVWYCIAVRGWRHRLVEGHVKHANLQQSSSRMRGQGRRPRRQGIEGLHVTAGKCPGSHCG